MRPARKTDWQTKDPPSTVCTIPLNRTFPPQEMERIRMGLVPEQMEDKWFIYWQDDTLFFHRSWTGICAFVVRFVAEGDAHRMIEADVNRGPIQHGEPSDVRDAMMISYLIDVLLLERQATFPGGGSDKAVMAQWGLVGRAMLGQHPTRGQGGDDT